MESGIWRAAALTVLVACGDGGLQWDGALGAPAPIVVELETPRVEAAVDSVDGGWFLIDTGAPYTILDTDSFAVVDGAHSVELQVFGATFHGHDVVAYDALPFPMGDDPMTGVLGGDLLREFTLQLDYRGERAWLFDDWDGAPPADVELALSATAELELRGGGRYLVPGACGGDCGTIDEPATRILVAVTIEGEPVLALVDTGASAVVLSSTLVDLLGDPGRPRLDGVTVGTAGGARDGYFTRVGDLVIDDSATLTSVPALVVPGWNLFDALSDEVGGDVQAIVGGSALRHYVVAIDYPAGELALAQYADPYHIDPREYVRPGFDLVRGVDEWVVGTVYPGTDADTQGVRVGEPVVELGGAAIAALDEAQLAQLLAGYAVGTRVPVGLDRAAGLETLDVLMEDLLPAYEGP